MGDKRVRMLLDFLTYTYMDYHYPWFGITDQEHYKNSVIHKKIKEQNDINGSMDNDVYPRMFRLPIKRKWIIHIKHINWHQILCIISRVVKESR